jgi:hypothetical protein
MALEARKEAGSAMESVKGSVEKLKNNGLQTTKTVKTEGKKKTGEAKKKTGEAVNGIKANGHAVAAGNFTLDHLQLL